MESEHSGVVDNGNTNGEPRSKRPRLKADVSVPTIPCSCEEFLSIPLHIIFRQVSNRKPLLTRSEAQTLLRIAHLARELDLLVSLTSRALERRVTCRHVQSMVRCSPTLRSLVPLLELHGTLLPNAALSYFQVELERVLGSFEICTTALKQYSEQNWTMSDSLLDAFGGSTVTSSAHVLANEKRILSDLQEELSKRIEHLMTNEGNVFDDYSTEDDLCMATICNRLFRIETPPLPMKRQEGNGTQVIANAQKPAVADGNGDAKASDLPPIHAVDENVGDNARVEATTGKINGTLSEFDEKPENATHDDQETGGISDKSVGPSPGRKETAHILATLEDVNHDEECDTGLLDQETEPLPDSMVNTQMAVSTLAGLTHRTNGSNVSLFT